MDKIKVSDIREKFPMYGDLNDDQLLIAIRKKYYPDIPANRFYGNIDYDTERQRLNKDLTDSMSTTDKLLAGAGKSFVDLGRSVKRVGNMIGIGDYTQEKAAQDEALDKPLMDTSAGAWGKGLTDAGLTFVPGLKGAQAITKGVQAGARMLPRAAGAINMAAPYVGAIGSGAAIGAATNPEDMATGAGGGALGGFAGEAGGRVLSAGWNGAKAVLDPLTQGGRERILKRTLERFATDPAKVRAAAANPVEHVPGVTPTLAEATMDPGIAQFQRGAASGSPDVASALAEARTRQFAGYKGALDDLAGNDGRMEFFTAARNSAADDLYGQARAAGLAPTREANRLMKDLMQRPSVQRAMVEARELAREKGIKIDDPAGSVEGLQFVKRALDGQIGTARTAGNTELASALKETQDKLLSYLDMASPMHGEARRTFAEMSRPVNQMAIGQKLRDTALPALTDFNNGALSRVNANSYATALRNADKTARTATGLKGATMQSVMDPAQMSTINGIGQDMARYAAAQELAKVPGSPTAQYLGVQNIMHQMMGPLGLPRSLADDLAQKVASGLAGIPYRMTQSQTEQLLARALTEPQTAAKIMAAKDPRSIAEILQPYMAQTVIQMSTQ